MIHPVALVEVKAALGTRWADVESRAVENAEHVIRRSLHSDVTFSRAQDGGFCHLLRRPVRGRGLVHRRHDRPAHPRAAWSAQGGDAAAMQVTAIASRVDVPATEDAGIDFAALLERRLNARRQEIEARARRMLAEAVAETNCTMVPVDTRDGPRAIASYAEIPPRAYRAMIAAHAGLPVAEQQKFDLDAAMLALAADGVQQALLNQAAATAFVDVDFQVFELRSARDAYVEACRRLNPALRQHLVLVLGHLPAGLPSSRLQDCMQRLRPFCRGVGFTIEEPRLETTDPLLDHAPIIVIDAAHVMGAEEKLGPAALGGAWPARPATCAQRSAPRGRRGAAAFAGVDLITMAGASR